MKNIILSEGQLERIFINENLNNMDAPLYHFTTLRGLYKILDSNVLGKYLPMPKRLRTKYNIKDSERYSDEVSSYLFSDNMFTVEAGSVSFTRDRNIDNGYSMNDDIKVRIKVMPYDLMKQRNLTLKPYNFFGNEDYKDIEDSKTPNNKKPSEKGKCRIGVGGRRWVENEERIVGSICNLNKVVVSIDILNDGFRCIRGIVDLLQSTYYESFVDKIRIYNNKNDFNFERVNKSIDIESLFKPK